MKTKLERFIEAASNAASKLESQVLRDPSLPEGYKLILSNFYAAREALEMAKSEQPESVLTRQKLSALRATIAHLASCTGCALCENKGFAYSWADAIAVLDEACKSPAPPLVPPPALKDALRESDKRCEAEVERIRSAERLTGADMQTRVNAPAEPVVAPRPPQPDCDYCENGDRLFILGGKAFHAGTDDAGDSCDVPCKASPLVVGQRPPCEHCANLDKAFAHLKDANTGAWQYRNEHGHWADCPTREPISEAEAVHPAPPPDWALRAADEILREVSVDPSAWPYPAGIAAIIRNNAAQQPTLSPQLLKRVFDEMQLEKPEHETDGETFHLKDCLRCELDKILWPTEYH